MQITPPAPDPPTSLPPAQVAKLHQAAQDFEAMALGQLLAPMFNTVDSAHSAFGGGEAETTLKPLLVDAIAKHIAAHGGLGLAAPVFASMLHTQEVANAAGRGAKAMMGAKAMPESKTMPEAMMGAKAMTGSKAMGGSHDDA